MAGIQDAFKRVSEGRNVGVVIAMGKTQNAPTTMNYVGHHPEQYMIIHLRGKAGGCITVYDYGTDIR